MNKTEAITKLHEFWSSGKSEEFKCYLVSKIGKFEVEQIDKNGRTAIWLAAGVGSADSVALLLKHKANKEFKCPCTAYTPLLAGVFWQHQKVLEILLSNRADVNAIDKHGNTALMLAAQLSSPIIADLLINAKADLNRSNKEGMTALMIASNRRKPEIVEKLLKAKANVNSHDQKGKTALSYAANTQIAQILLNHHADPNIQDSEGKTVFDHMKNRPEILALLNNKM